MYSYREHNDFVNSVLPASCFMLTENRNFLIVFIFNHFFVFLFIPVWNMQFMHCRWRLESLKED